MSETFPVVDVPYLRLISGKPIPRLGLGTFGSDKYGPQEIAGAVLDAAEIGYRHFDCAAVYGNEREIGLALEDVRKNGIAREDFWVTSKLWNNRHGDPEAACEETLRDLRLDCLDLYLIHWPFPNFHPQGVGVHSRDPNAKPYIHDDYMRTWRALESLVARGLVRHIGTSNMTIPKLKLLLRDAEIRPAANEMELHPHLQQPELFRYVVENGMLPIAYCPLGSPSRPERDRTPEDTSDIDDPVIREIAARRGMTPAAVCVKWAIGRGQIPIPFSVKRAQYEDSLRAATGEPLSAEEMSAIAKIDRGCRLIKGQVFLWKGADDWTALWDEDGTIAS